MFTLRRLLPPLFLAFGAFLAPPAHAAGGGSTLPFNDALTLIQDNLTGPTANTIIVVLIIAALVTVGISREGSWLKPLGGCVVLCALLAKAATLPSVLGLGAATAAPFDYLVPSLLLSSTWLLATTGALYALYSWLAEGGRGNRRSAERLDVEA
jgi:type IV secretory pathway VirB2 component (pilin)